MGFQLKMLYCGNNSVKCRKPGSVPFYPNVYDLTSMNKYAYWLGLSVYHSGVQVHGVEYAFGSHEQLTTGIFDGEPKQCEGFTFRTTHYTWISYNSPETANHLCNDACLRLTGNPMPNWINLLARIGFLCNCIVSASINSTKVRIEDNKVCNEVEIKTKLRGRSNRFTSSSSSPSSSSVDRTRSHGRALLHPSSLLMLVSSSSRSIAVSIK